MTDLIKKLQANIDDLSGELNEPDGLSADEIALISKTLETTKAKLVEAKANYEKSQATPAKMTKVEAVPAPKVEPAPKVKEEPMPKEEPKPKVVAMPKKEESAPKPIAKLVKTDEPVEKRISWITEMSIEDIRKYGKVNSSGAPSSCQRRIVCHLDKDIEVHIKGNVTVKARKGEYLEFVHIGDGKFRQFNVIANVTNCEIGKAISTTDAFLLALMDDAEGRRKDSTENQAPFFVAHERLERLVPFLNKLTEPMLISVDDTTINIKPRKGGAYDDNANVLMVTISVPNGNAMFEVYNRLSGAEPLAYFSEKSDLKVLKSLLDDDTTIRKAAREWAKENKPSLLVERKPKPEQTPIPTPPVAATKTKEEATAKPNTEKVKEPVKHCAVKAKEDKDKLFTYLATAANAYANGLTDQKVSKVYLTVDKKAVLEIKEKGKKVSYARLCPQTGRINETTSFNPDKEDVTVISTKSVEKLFTTQGAPNMSDCADIVQAFYEKCKDGKCTSDEFKAFHEAAIGCKIAHNDKEHKQFLMNFTKEVLVTMKAKKLSFQDAWLHVLNLTN